MLGLLLIYFIGKKFFDLAKKFGKSEWGFAILGVVIYYVGTLIAGIIIVLGYELSSSSSIDDLNEFALSFISLPFGILSCIGLHYYLKNTWHKNKEAIKPNIDEIGTR